MLFRSLLLSTIHDPDVLDDEVVRQIAEHLGSTDRARRLYLLSLARRDLDAFERAVLDELDERLLAELARHNGSNLCDARRAAAQRLATTPEVVERLAHAPRSYILANEPDELVRQATLAEPAPRPGTVRVAVTGDERPGCWRVDIATVDRHGLLAVITGSLADAGLDVLGASAATWGDRVVIDSFVVSSAKRPSARELSLAIETRLREDLPARPLSGAQVQFDNSLLPWHTSCTVEVEDRPGVLAAITTAFAVAGVEVHSARIGSSHGRARDRFSLSLRDGAKLDEPTMDRIRRALAGELRTRGRRR